MVHVYLVNGEYVRENLFPDFVQGGHWLVYRFIPEGEIWLDNQVRPRERPFILFHELYEANLMSRGWDYPEAHKSASQQEFELRQHPEKLVDYGLESVVGVEALVGPDETYELRAAPNLDNQEQTLGDELGKIAWEERDHKEKLKQEFLRRLREALLAILLMLGYNTGESETTDLLDAAIAEQETFLDGFIADVDGLSQSQIEARADLYAGSLGSYYNAWWLIKQGDRDLKWVYNPEAKHCGDCVDLDGQIRKASEWYSAGLWPKSGNTQCLSNCKCELMEV